MIWIVLLIVAAVMGVVIYFTMKSHNKMVADGKIISRRTNFMESAKEDRTCPMVLLSLWLLFV